MAGFRKRAARERRESGRLRRRRLRRFQLAGLIVVVVVVAATVVAWFTPLIDEMRHPSPSVQVDLGHVDGRDRLRPVEGL